ncbi:MAG: M48 family metallopeptidase [Bacteroidales bacterium]|nr:M48 family metallopeptidase [Bacteroidales bacterium]
MHNIWFYIIVGIILINFVLSTLISYLNIKSLKSEVPEEMADFYDSEKYAKSQNYTRTNNRFSLITGTFSLVVILLMLFFDGFAFIDKLASDYAEGTVLISLIFFGILFLANGIINLPFEIYDTFVIEKKFGFNKTTPKTFIGDKIKGLLLSFLLGGGILALIIYLYTLAEQMFWIYAWIAVSSISIFIAMFYSNLIVPLFNKQTPLPESELRTAIENFAQTTGFELNNIYQIDGSKRSSKANAYFSGLGPKKRIVLYDTLIEQMTNAEIVAVLAHEIGHYKKKHLIKGVFVSIINTGITLYLFSLFVSYPQISEALGVNGIKFHIALIAFAVLYTPISMITSLIMNISSRKNEFEADNFAKNHKLSGELISGLKKLSVNNLSNLTPHPFNVFMNYSHPPLLKRIENLKKKL